MQILKEEDRKIKEEGQHPVDPSVFWMVQTVCIDDFGCSLLVFFKLH